MLTYASGLSAAAAGLLVVMLAIAIQSGGVTQQRFELYAPLDAYSAAFAAAKPTILHTLIFDNLFVIAYTGALSLGFWTLATRETRLAAGFAVAGIAAAGLLDYAENLHFIVMYARLDSGALLTAEELGWRMWASMLKWHLVYAGLAIGSFAIPVRGLVSLCLVWSLRVILPVAGVLIYAGPPEWHAMLGIVRYALMLAGFAMFAVVFAANAGPDASAS
jgi:hypothetical protein